MWILWRDQGIQLNTYIHIYIYTYIYIPISILLTFLRDCDIFWFTFRTPEKISNSTAPCPPSQQANQLMTWVKVLVWDASPHTVGIILLWRGKLRDAQFSGCVHNCVQRPQIHHSLFHGLWIQVLYLHSHLNQDSTFSLGNPLERPIPKSSGTLSCRPGPHEETSGQWWPGLRTLKTLRDVDIWNIYVHICKWYDKNVKRNKVNPSTFGGVVSKGCHVTKGVLTRIKLGFPSLSRPALISSSRAVSKL